jgi:hypothetical protein
VGSLCEQAGLGKTSRSTTARLYTELRERFEAFKRRDLHETKLVVLSSDVARTGRAAIVIGSEEHRHRT